MAISFALYSIKEKKYSFILFLTLQVKRARTYSKFLFLPFSRFLNECQNARGAESSSHLVDSLIRLFLLTHVVVIRSEAVCESAISILKQHIHDNRALDHESLDEEMMLHWNASPLHLADSFIKSSSNN